MSDIKLFRTSDGTVTELAGEGFTLEKSLQNLIETHLETFLGVRFMATEYSTGATHKGRIDTLGIDRNGCPVIIEYKRSSNQNVINQGLFYLNWLLDHKAEFQLLVMKNLGNDEADQIEWSQCRLVCIAGNFTKYDEHAVQQIDRNIDLIRYRRFAEDLLLLELVASGRDPAAVFSKRPARPTSTASSILEDDEAPEGDAETQTRDSQDRKRFFEGFLRKAEERTELFQGREATDRYWLAAKAGFAGAGFLAVVLLQDTARVEFYIDSGSRERNNALFDAIAESRAEIEERFGKPLVWDRRDDRRASKVSWTTKSGGRGRPETWDSLQAELVELVIRLDHAIRQPVLEAVQ